MGQICTMAASAAASAIAAGLRGFGEEDYRGKKGEETSFFASEESQRWSLCSRSIRCCCVLLSYWSFSFSS